jgi:divalent metal cation (Fe/Co/Zn/Cd) transporter
VNDAVTLPDVVVIAGGLIAVLGLLWAMWLGEPWAVVVVGLLIVSTGVGLHLRGRFDGAA